jgi:hypothetical protein
MSHATTHTVGYYNGNKWPIQLVISKLNITLHLQPGEYILDQSRRKINDPFFDAYKQLSKEISDDPVPLLTVPAITTATAATSAGSSPVRATSKFVLDKSGRAPPGAASFNVACCR